MKKFIYLFAIIGLIISSFPTPKAEACSFLPGTQFPTPQEVLNSGGKISIVKPLASGQVVAAQVQNYPVIMTVVAIPTQYVVLEGRYTSCATMFDFNSNKYYVVVTPANDAFVIRPSTGGKQFVTAYNTMSEAEDAYDTLASNQNPNPQPSNYTPVGYTLKYGMRGNDVRALQQALKTSLSYMTTTATIPPLTVDGVYGSQTVVAVKFYQSMMQLTSDGIAGTATQNMLSNLNRAVPTAQ